MIIEAPQVFHREIAEAAFARKKPVLCEKPLGASLEDSRAMVAAADAAGVANRSASTMFERPQPSSPASLSLTAP